MANSIELVFRLALTTSTFHRLYVMIYEESDQALFRLFQHTSYVGLKRFIISLLQLRKSHLLLEHIGIFSEDPSLKVQALRAVGRHNDVASISDGIQTVDLPFIVDSRKRAGAPIDPIISPLNILYHQQGRQPWQGKLLLNACEYSEVSAPREVSWDKPLLERQSSDEPVIFGITMIKLITDSTYFLFDHLLSYCDYVIAAIPQDQFVEARDYANIEKVCFIEQPLEYNDGEIYKSLFREGRARGATHYLRIDDDERIEVSLDPKQFRLMCSNMSPGEALTMPWVQIFGNEADVEMNFQMMSEFTNIRNLGPLKDVVYCDDGEAMPFNMAFHCPWIPSEKLKRRYFSDYGLLHFEGTDITSLKNKFNRYLHWDYSINKNIGVIYERYLPMLLRLVLVDAVDQSLFKPYARGDYSRVPAELNGTRYKQTLDEVKSLFPVVNSAHRQLLLDILAPAK